MASLPPDTIHVKRKRGTDEAPVDFLRLEPSKRSRSGSRSDGTWVYQRKTATDVDAARSPTAITDPSSPAFPQIQATHDGDEQRLLKRPGERARASPTPSLDATTPGTAPATATPNQPLSNPATDRIRRFHLSRPNSPQPPAPGGISKKRSMPAIFVERGAKKQREALAKVLMQEQNVAPAEQTSSPKPAPDVSQPAEPPSHTTTTTTTEEKESHAATASSQQPPSASSPRKFKRPGTRTTSKTKPELPPSMRQPPENTSNMDELARIMDDWTLSEIAKNLGRIDEQSTTSKFSPAKPSRFKPKAPAKRYFERHPPPTQPQPVPQVNRRASIMDVDTVPELAPAESTDEDSDGDYILEVYERVPAERLQDQAVPAHKVGLLVFDTEPDMVEFFYGNQSESEDEFPEDEDDENAENYYAADYPDEDLDWDDEFNRNPYHYTNQNDSDMEEFDERDFIDEVLERSGEQEEETDAGYIRLRITGPG
ncbi:hypothetical protein VTJ49DRAFT_5809 [Mycothermus thermophilus]|uniref:Transcription factor Iwr1 domain-containing protein n=1 Tax=Humicola insolens TaxID=85995 RepID=A0ABR3VQB7_HUMIN